MKTILRTGFFIIVLLMELAGVSFGKEVYLQDGGIIDCESFWMHNNQIVVKVNRDVILIFESGEIDVPKTFHAAKKKTHRIKQKKHTSNRPASDTAISIVQVTAAVPLATAAQTATITAPVSAQTSPQKLATAKPTAASSSAPPSAPAVVLAAASHPESVEETSAPPAAALTMEEYQRRTKENTKLMAEAMRKSDPELLKKAVEAQRSLVRQQKNAPPKPEPPWFKYLLMLCVSVLLMVISVWVIFEKAGQSGVKSVIPMYNAYVLMEVAGKPGWWFILLLIPGVGLPFHLLAMLSLAEKFGRSTLFGIGLLFLPMFFLPMLAFGGSKYEAPRKEMNFIFSEET
jgi:hypothetical protein